MTAFDDCRNPISLLVNCSLLLLLVRSLSKHTNNSFFHKYFCLDIHATLMMEPLPNDHAIIYCNIVGRKMFHTFGHPAATCWLLLAQIWPFSSLSRKTIQHVLRCCHVLDMLRYSTAQIYVTAVISHTHPPTIFSHFKNYVLVDVNQMYPWQ